jgi:HPr kinase/phosphorylase
MTRILVHGTCVALGDRAALLRGNSGSGKSDLALRFLALPADGAHRPALVADDQVFVETQDTGAVTVSPPETIAGDMEVRGLGIMEMPSIASARLVLVCDLVAADEVPRLPPDPWDRTAVVGVEIPLLKLSPFEASAPLKLKMALLRAPEQ